MQIVRTQYAGFWKRFAASFIDSVILYIVEAVAMVPLSTLIPELAMTNNETITAASSGPILFALTISIVIGWLYYALMESSDSGATPGKMIMGIKVTDLNGKRVSFGRATGRYFGKMVSYLTLFIGFIMVGFTAKKQGLHDMMAGCLVLNK
jgi:uncharacterized RDD family membrane protein YckC